MQPLFWCGVFCWCCYHQQPLRTLSLMGVALGRGGDRENCFQVAQILSRNQREYRYRYLLLTTKLCKEKKKGKQRQKRERQVEVNLQRILSTAIVKATLVQMRSTFATLDPCDVTSLWQFTKSKTLGQLFPLCSHRWGTGHFNHLF